MRKILNFILAVLAVFIGFSLLMKAINTTSEKFENERIENNEHTPIIEDEKLSNNGNIRTRRKISL